MVFRPAHLVTADECDGVEEVGYTVTPLIVIKALGHLLEGWAALERHLVVGWAREREKEVGVA